VRKSVGDVQPLREAVEPGGILVGKTFGRRRPPQRLSEQVPRLDDPADLASLPGRPQRRYNPFPRPLDFRLLRGPGLGSGDQHLRDFFEVAVSIEEALRQPMDQRRWRVVGNEVARELCRDVSRCCRMMREIEQRQSADQHYLEEGVTILEMARNAQRLFDSEEPMQKRRLLNFVVSNSTWANGELNANLREPFGFIAEMARFTSGGGSSNGANFADHSGWLGN